jgi:hypothetical protein
MGTYHVGMIMAIVDTIMAFRRVQHAASCCDEEGQGNSTRHPISPRKAVVRTIGQA